MIRPILAPARRQLRILHLELHVLIVACEALARQTAHVLKDESSRLGLADGADGLWEHIAPVGMGAMPSPH